MEIDIFTNNKAITEIAMPYGLPKDHSTSLIHTLSMSLWLSQRRKFSFRGGGGGGGGGAKLHEFPTLHRSARFTIAYCFTKTTLGHI